ncbi:hypothetical protein EVAR_82692_1 [Eumeta japonica]|uniref:Uncharacterized protein n=1 Tax=Eumeta variegata TaxID=151549 RepID=A0A4C1VBV8_EUMVA|nr:hypothetical protein EVAR_82692_1 [Eumeta japonica]
MINGDLPNQRMQKGGRRLLAVPALLKLVNRLAIEFVQSTQPGQLSFDRSPSVLSWEYDSFAGKNLLIATTYDPEPPNINNRPRPLSWRQSTLVVRLALRRLWPLTVPT